MKIYGKIYRKTVPTVQTETVTKEIYYILEKEDTKKAKKQQSRSNRAIIFIGFIIASGIWTLCNRLKTNKKEQEA